MSLRLFRLPSGSTDGHYWVNPEAIAAIYVASDGIMSISMGDGLDIDVRAGSKAGKIVEQIIAEASAGNNYSVNLTEGTGNAPG